MGKDYVRENSISLVCCNRLHPCKTQTSAMAGPIKATLASLKNLLSQNQRSIEPDLSPTLQELKLPDLLATFPNAARDFRISSFCKEISEASDAWAEENIGLSASKLRPARPTNTAGRGTSVPSHNDLETDETLDLMTGLLASMCLPTAGRTQLRLCADYLAWAVLLQYQTQTIDTRSTGDYIQENISLVMMEPGSSKVAEQSFAGGLQRYVHPINAYFRWINDFL